MYKKILLPLDGSALSEHALEHAQTIIAGNPKIELVLLRVVEPLPPVSYYAYGAAELYRDIEEKAQREAKDYLAKIEDSVIKQGITTETIILHGMPDHEILGFLAKNKVDLIIMSTHGRSGVSRFFTGSVAERIMRHSTIPVLIVPPPGSRIAK